MDFQTTLREFLEKHRGEKHIIVLHDSPDPGAISSAYAHRLISQDFGIDTAICYSGKANQQRNVALLKLLGIDLLKYSDSLDLSQYNGAILIDNQGATCETILKAVQNAGVPVLAVFDHHEPQEKLKPAFSDLRRAGSTATIYAHYLEEGMVELDKSRKEHVAAATALLYGILTDTLNFVIAQPADFEAAAFLSRFRDADFLEHIMSQSRSRQVMEIIRRALGDREIVESYSIAGIGYLRSEDREAISQAAEFLLTEENVHTAIVYGIIRESEQDETLIGAMHTSKITLYPEEFLREVFGENLVTTGGMLDHLSTGAFSIPIGFLAGDTSDKLKDLKWQVYDAQVKYKLFTRIGVTRAANETPSKA